MTINWDMTKELGQIAAIARQICSFYAIDSPSSISFFTPRIFNKRISEYVGNEIFECKGRCSTIFMISIVVHVKRL